MGKTDDAYYGQDNPEEPFYGEDRDPDETAGGAAGDQAAMRPTGSGGSAPPPDTGSGTGSDTGEGPAR